MIYSLPQNVINLTLISQITSCCIYHYRTCHHKLLRRVLEQTDVKVPYINDVRKKSAILPIAEQKNIYPACERIHHQEKDKNHQWMLCRVGRDTDPRCGQPSASSNICFFRKSKMVCATLN